MDEINSILDSVKKKLGMDPKTMTEFDPDVIDAINMAISTLTQLGVGPDTGFAIHDSKANWSDFIGEDPRLSMARSYVFIKTRLVFDPPQTSYVLSSLQDQARELEWRLNAFVECPKSFPCSQTRQRQNTMGNSARP